MVQRNRVLFTGSAALLGWSALLLQYGLVIELARAGNIPFAFATANFFSYFTILTNLLVAVAFTSQLLVPTSRVRAFFARPATTGAVTVCIAVVGLVYSLALRSLWHPTGLQRVADQLLHDVMPVVWIVYWIVFAARGRVDWRVLPVWLLYPLAWFAWILLRGSWTGFYPYPFIDVTVLGYVRTVLNALVVLCLFALLACIVMAVGRMLARSGTRRGAHDATLEPMPTGPLHGQPHDTTGDH